MSQFPDYQGTIQAAKCPCGVGADPPPFVADDYYCESALEDDGCVQFRTVAGGDGHLPISQQGFPGSSDPTGDSTKSAKAHSMLHL